MTDNEPNVSSDINAYSLIIKLRFPSNQLVSDADGLRLRTCEIKMLLITECPRLKAFMNLVVY
jgi:hypothetical protein